MTTHADDLKKKLKQHQDIEVNVYLRLHRAISWLKASKENESNSDLRFICLWISLNSCYAVDADLEGNNAIPTKESNDLNAFLVKLVSCDETRKIYDLLWNRYSSEIRLILNNQYLFKPFWDFQRGLILDYRSKLEASIAKANLCLSKGDAVGLLRVVLERLYVLRNQIFHGSATYKGRVNRKQIMDSSEVLSRFLPIIILVMTENSRLDWGKTRFPVINMPKT
jgi:hypothetical protein